MLTTTRSEVTFDNLKGLGRYDLRNNSNVQYTTSSDIDNNDVAQATAVTYSEDIIKRKLFGDIEIADQIAPNIQEKNENPNIMPSNTTMSYINPTATLNNKVTTISRTNTMGKTQLNTQGKVLVASFFTVFFAVVLAITLLSISIVSSSAALAGLQSTLNGKLAQLETMENSLSSFEDTTRIENIAQGELGLGYPTDGQTVKYVPLMTKSQQNLTSSTNWFDKVCDWVSSIFGG